MPQAHAMLSITPHGHREVTVLGNRLASEFGVSDTIRTEEDLRAAGGNQSWLRSKILAKLDNHCRQFIAESPFIVIASTGQDNRVDVSPKGDRPGFVQVLDDVTLGVPDRSGNRQFDTFRNVLKNPNVGLIFFVPGKRETLRIGGKAQIVTELAVRRTMAVSGWIPKLVTVITIERAFFHCGSCIARSKLWELDQRGFGPK
jgi:PPOX class probable FMN-dependent enzyme